MFSLRRIIAAVAPPRFPTVAVAVTVASAFRSAVVAVAVTVASASRSAVVAVAVTIASASRIAVVAVAVTVAFSAIGVSAQQRGVPQAPDRAAGEGEGPFERLIVRGVTIIDGTGAPPYGPVDIVIENNRIVEMRQVGSPGLPIDTRRRPGNATKELDANGMYAMPGFVDLHAHTGGTAQNGGTSAEYVYKLWLAHGVTTIRDPGSGNGVDWTLTARERSASNRIVAPRTFVYIRPGAGWDGGAVNTPDKARAFVQWAAKKGVDGFKLGSHEPDIMAALLDEAKKHGLGTQAHLAQTGVAQMNVLDAARLGLGSMEHWYVCPKHSSATGPSRTILPTTTTTTSITASRRPAASGNRPRHRTATSGTRS